MTADIVRWDDTPRVLEITGPNLPAAVALLAEWAVSADAAYSLAQKLVTTSFVPAPFKGKPDEAAAAILAGAELGLQPMAALRSFDIIQGIAAPRANTLRAIVQGRGHTVRLVESTETRAVVEGWRLGQTKADAQRSTWTIDRAKNMQLTGKDNWRKQPGAMLVARATSELCRLIASDAILGVAYSSEEIVDGTDEPATTAPVKAAAPRTARRTTLARVEPPEPPLDDEPGLEEFAPETTTNPVEAVEAITLLTKPQSVAIHAHMTALGIKGRDEGLEYLSRLVGRELASSKDITKAEASALIDEFTAPTLDDSWPPVTGTDEA